MSTPNDSSASFFADQPFGNVVASPSQQTLIAVAGFTDFGPFDCSQSQGARFSFKCANGSGLTIIRVTYFDDQSLANDIGERWWMVPNGGFLNCTMPHLGDVMQVRIFCADAVNGTDVTWSIAMRQNTVTQWNLTPSIVLGRPTTPTSVLSEGVNIAMGAGTSNLSSAGCNGVYAGPAHAWLASPIAAVKVFIQQRDLNNVFQTNCEVQLDANGIANIDFQVWPMSTGADIRIHVVNPGAASTLSWTITADEYRIGGG